MTCQVCGGKTTVSDVVKESDVIYRKRKSTDCKEVFYTEEIESDRDDWLEAERKEAKRRAREKGKREEKAPMV